MGAWLRTRLTTIPDRHGGRWVVVALCAIVALGVGLRLYWAVEREGGVQDDSIRYFFIAESLYDHGTFDAVEVNKDEAYHPGSPLFHAGVFFLTGGVNPKASRILVALLSSLMIVCVFLLARRLAWGPQRGPPGEAPPIEATVAGLAGASMIAVYPSSIDFYRSMMNEPLSSITLVAAVLSFIWAADNGHGKPWRWLVPGALLGLTVMFRPEALAIGVLLAIVALAHVWRIRERNAGLAAAAVFLIAMAVVLLPWSIRNSISQDRFAPFTDGGGNALFIGTYLPGDGDHFKTFDRREQLMDDYGVPQAQRDKLEPADTLELNDVLDTIAREEDESRPPDEVLSKLGREQLRDDISDHPVEYAGVLAQKFWNMWGQGAAAKSRQGGPGLPGDIFHILVVALGLAGLVLLAIRKRWEAWILGVVLGFATLVAVVLLAPPRRQVDLLPLVSALAGYAVAAGWVTLRR